MSQVAIFWFRRDLRISDNPALLAALAEGDEVLPIFIIDQAISDRAGDFRRSYLASALKNLDKTLAGNLQVFNGDAVEILQSLTKKYNALSIHCAKQYAPYGVALEKRISESGIKLNFTGCDYAVDPGKVRKPDGTPYKVYTPFFKAWSVIGWERPYNEPKSPKWVNAKDKDRYFPDWDLTEKTETFEVGTDIALEKWSKFFKEPINSYNHNRNFPGIKGTSGMSPHLRWGEIHPRTLLANLNSSADQEVYRKEIAWREFYADVLHHNPHTSREYLNPQFTKMRYDKPGKKFEAWCEGKTGFPFVDAGMRQLIQTGWMHNRVRMVVASFLAKDLHIEWQHGANFFMQYLIDNDVASNSHGWQWTAGCGTDASPYYRIFNPIEQGKRFDPEGDYIRKYVPELAHLTGADIHEPWLYLDGYSGGYIERIVDHAAERIESLARLEEIKVSAHL
jgi:deoxyribodipyrimidine photo-lyase